ncbi:uncharacterized protein LOC141761099 [Sebastes fasciatus]|uniref:uncharacterized protein LOC141761099 n=1 Tax=Sebastes fasciatus TaxID=394691 RepID=UPI003D9F034C
MKAYKSTDSYMYFRSGWVNNAAVWEVKDKKFFIVKAKCRVIQKETRLQSKCAMWFDQKAGSVTASNIRAACHTDPDKPAVSLLKKLCYPVAFKDPNNNTPHSLRWGIEHERKVVEEYTKMMEKFHTNLTVKKAGLVINPQYPWLGASPDGILTCDCHEMGVLEVKAPSSLQNSTLMEKCKEDSMFCLQEVEGKLSLKRDHQYFCQVQTQIHLTQASYCDFAVWGPGKEGKGEIHIERILPDTDFFDTMCEKVHIFVQKCVIPELVAKVFTAPVLPTSHDTSKPSESKGCYCGLPVLQNEDRLECKSGICKRQYIHRSCLKLDTSHSKMSSWKCSDCKREIAKQKKDNRKKT